MQGFITALARRTPYVEKHGEVMAVQPHDGATFAGGGYLATRLYDTTFADGTELTFFVTLGVPTEASHWRTKR